MKTFFGSLSPRKEKEIPFLVGMQNVRKLGWRLDKKKRRNQYARNPKINNKIEMNRAAALKKLYSKKQEKDGKN